MLRDEFAPALRARGLKGSGSTYVLPDEINWLQIGFQSSRWNSSDRVKFTVNLSVVEKDVWTRLAGERGYAGIPNPHTMYFGGIGARRLGTLAFGEDRWWDVTTSSTSAAAEVLEAIDRVGIPFLRSGSLPAT